MAVTVKKQTVNFVKDIASEAKKLKTKYYKVDEKYFNTKGQGNENKNSGTGSDFNKRVDKQLPLLQGL